MDQINHHSKKVAIIGLGYVGLPLAILFVEKGFQVIGIDINLAKIASLQNGRSYLSDLSDQEVVLLQETGRFEATNRFNKVTETDACIICVPTPLRDDRQPDLSYLRSAAYEILPYIKDRQLIVLESSTYPGTTEEVLLPILEKSGKKTGIDFYLAYSPERIEPGNKAYTLEQIPKVISGITQQCQTMVYQFYSQVFQQVVPVSSTRVAEMTKILENCHRFVNISFMNELAIICHEMNINLWEAIEAASTKPYGFTPYYPGPGIGGHCIPVDPLYLQWKAMQYEIDSRFIELSKKINDRMPQYVVGRLKKLLPECGKQTRLLLLGVTYKKDINDLRESPQLEIFKKLLENGWNVQYHDPFIPQVSIHEQTYTSIDLTPNVLKNSDCVVILTDHSCLPYEQIIAQAPLIFDTRNSIKKNLPNVVRL